MRMAEGRLTRRKRRGARSEPQASEVDRLAPRGARRRRAELARLARRAARGVVGRGVRGRAREATRRARSSRRPTARSSASRSRARRRRGGAPDASAVDAAHQGRGSAAGSPRRCSRELRAEGVARVHLEVRGSNAAALALYGALGFSRVAPPRGLLSRRRGRARAGGGALIYTRGDGRALGAHPAAPRGARLARSQARAVRHARPRSRAPAPRPAAAATDGGVPGLRAEARVPLQAGGPRHARCSARRRRALALSLLGPLGNGFAPPRAGDWLVGGGTGIASLYELARDAPRGRARLPGRPHARRRARASRTSRSSASSCASPPTTARPVTAASSPTSSRRARARRCTRAAPTA